MKKKLLAYFLFLLNKTKYRRSLEQLKTPFNQRVYSLKQFKYATILLFVFGSFTPTSAAENSKLIPNYTNKHVSIMEKKSLTFALTADIANSGTAAFCKSPTGADISARIKITVLGGSGTYTLKFRGPKGDVTVLNYISGSPITVTQNKTSTYTLISVVQNSTGLSAGITTNNATVTIFDPILEQITQSTCLVPTGSVSISSLPVSAWTIKKISNDQLLASGSTSTFTLSLPIGVNEFKITNSAGCIVNYKVTINPQPTSINIPVLEYAPLPCSKDSFVQDWTAVPDATGYRIDVATDSNFTNFVSGYENKLLGNVTSETITGINPAGTYYVRLRAVSDCFVSSNSNVSTVFTHTTAYNGVWSDGLPDINKNVIFNSDFNIATNTNACSCQVNAGANVVVQSGIDLKIENGLTVNPAGSLTFENNASLIQINNVPNSGNVTYKRITAPMKNFDYTYWSSPVSNQTLYNISPNTLGDKYFSYGPNGWVTLYNGTAVMEPGIGYIIRTPKDGTWPNGEVVSFPYSQQVKFIGVPNNGNINGETVPADKYRLVGNPYPSALDADQFMADNSSILSGTIYLWTHNTVITNNKYTSDDYAAYNGVGGIATRPAINSGINNSEPTGKIAAGQSFMIASTAAGTITFNNGMRPDGNNGQFFKQTKNNKTAIEKHRFWLNLTNKTGAFKQILIGYLPGATNEYDNRFDGDALNGNTFINFYSKTQTTNLLIQGRALPLEDTDSIILGYSSTIDGVFSIDISKLDGKFVNKAIYLEDKKTNTYFNLKNGGYEFSTLKGTFDDRFVIHYIPNTIQTPVLAEVPEMTCNQASFVLNWEAIPNASSYRYDVATDEEFTNIIPELLDREVSGYNSEEIMGLTGTNYYVRLRAMYNSVASPNSNVIKVSSSTTIYNGEWSNGLPDSNKNVIFDNVNYTLSADISACSCQINATAKITVPSGVTLKLQNGLTVKDQGSLTFENNASLVQINEAVNIGNIIYKRISAPMKNADYTYWSSPVAEQKLNVLSPNTLSNKYFSLYNNNWVPEQGSAFMTVAKGYIIGAPKGGKWPNGEIVSFPYSQPVQFMGIPNNGRYEFIAENSGSKNLIGNPYPSAIDADAFLSANSSVLGGTIYFWRNNTSPQFLKYLLDDYACYNALGGVAASAAGETSGGLNSIKPTGKIASGQSFMTESIAPGTVVFENNMRVEGENKQFLKSGKTASTEKHLFWLNLTNPLGAFEQILIGYADGATNNYDNRFDARDWSGNSYTSFYSVNQNDKLTIQGRALPFDNADVVPLGYRSLLGGYFTIALDSADGLFTDQAIYLEDKKLKVFHNLKDGAYNFVSFLGTYDNRFVIHYASNKTNKTAKNTASDAIGLENEVLVSAENNQIKVNTFEEIIDNVFVFDLNGKLIYEKEQVNTNEFSTPTLIFNNQMVVVKVTLQNGKTIIKKAIL
ncbi:T9SS sorting signal type C domain-containing protein [Flavobacterium sp. JLP]|uniref:T9SS sorting signal type C domain-containing protein n=1 Tax=Flavobacterium sp. JLP TaxID=2783793 RepID=UPI00188D363F|nr:T9SS sorting signal type C domain-containing protein [Flavobacterium sp. JLP]MBF4508833.1 T9SS sorting signal type C domain-containing protein [Flavobacterium sp. JLP]